MLFKYVKVSFDKLTDSISHDGAWEYYSKNLVMTIDGQLAANRDPQLHSDDENEDADEKQFEQVSIFPRNK